MVVVCDGWDLFCLHDELEEGLMMHIPVHPPFGARRSIASKKCFPAFFSKWVLIMGILSAK